MKRKRSHRIKKGVIAAAHAAPRASALEITAPVRPIELPEGAPESATRLTYLEFRSLLKSPPGTHRLRLITPELWQTILRDHNAGNSHIQQSSVDTYASDMLAGEWKYTGDPVTFDSDGNLVSGQHRGLAAIKTNSTYQFDMIFGLNGAEARAKRNTGKRDKPADFLASVGWEHATTVAPMVRWIMLYRNSVGGAPSRETYSPSHYPALASALDRDGLDHCARVALEIKKQGVQVPAQTIGSIYYLARETHAADAEKFFGDWAKGKPSPILVKAQKKFNGMTNRKKGENQSGKDWDKVVSLALAWNNWRAPNARAANERLEWATTEPVPEII